MKKLFFVTTLLFVSSSFQAKAWGNLGHTTIAYIAENHLTDKAKSNIESYIGHRSIAYYASLMDVIRTIPPYDVTHQWHVDYWTDDMRQDENGNPLSPRSVDNINRIVKDMIDNFRNLPDSLVSINIKYLTHLVGDMHCPVHVNFVRRPKVMLNGKKYSYHKMWDSYISTHKHPNISPLQYCKELDLTESEQIEKVIEGEPNQWYDQTLEMADSLYNMMPKDMVITDDNYINQAIYYNDLQLQRAGLRLAKILNLIFDK